MKLNRINNKKIVKRDVMITDKLLSRNFILAKNKEKTGADG